MEKTGNPQFRSSKQTGRTASLFRRVMVFLVMAAFTSPHFGWCSEVSSIIPVCDGCHGQNGVSLNPEVPTIAGQAFTLIEDNLLDYRSDRNSCAESQIMSNTAVALLTTMCSIVVQLDERDIQGLAEHYEAQIFVPSIQEFDAGLASIGARIHRQAGCEQCHSDHGRKSNGMAAILAGQWTPYLVRALKRIRAGEKKGPREMIRSIQELGEEDLQALLNLYAASGDQDFTSR
jgi:sulfide dehydrogenase cytochrome subunit